MRSWSPMRRGRGKSNLNSRFDDGPEASTFDTPPGPSSSQPETTPQRSSSVRSASAQDSPPEQRQGSQPRPAAAANPPQVVAHNYLEEHVGRRIKWAKKKYTWAFSAKGAEETQVVLKSSWFSGRRTVYVNDTAVYDQILTSAEQKSFQFDVPVNDSVRVTVAAQGRGKYTLSVNGVAFDQHEQQPVDSFNAQSRGREMLQSPMTSPRGQDVKVDALFDKVDPAGEGRALKAAIIEAIKSDPEIQEILKLPRESPAQAATIVDQNFKDVSVDNEGKMSREDFQKMCLQIILTNDPSTASAGSSSGVRRLDMSSVMQEAGAGEAHAQGQEGTRRRRRKREQQQAAFGGDAAWGGDGFMPDSAAGSDGVVPPPPSNMEDGGWPTDFGGPQQSGDFPTVGFSEGASAGGGRWNSNHEASGGDPFASAAGRSRHRAQEEDDDPFGEITPELSGPWRYDQRHPFTTIPADRVRLLQHIWDETVAVPIGSYGFGDPYEGSVDAQANFAKRGGNDAAFGQAGPEQDAWADVPAPKDPSKVEGQQTENKTSRRSRRHERSGRS